MAFAQEPSGESIAEICLQRFLEQDFVESFFFNYKIVSE